VPLERATARVCREAGARVATNVPLRNLNLQGVPPHDERQLEVVANGLPVWGGVQLAVDATLVFPVRRNGTARPRAATEDGAALVDAARRKRRRYPEFGARGRCHLVVLGLEVGGRWSEEATIFVRLLAQAKARAAPEVLRRSAELAWQRRWSAILAVAAQRSLAASLLELPLDALGGAFSGRRPWG